MSSQMLRLDDFTEPFYSYNNVFIIVIMFSSQKAVQTGVTRFGRLDCLINNVGVRKFVYGTAAVADNNGVVCDELDDNDDDGGDDGVDSGGGDTDDDVDDEDADGGDNADGRGGDFKIQMYILMTTTMTSAIEIIFYRSTFVGSAWSFGFFISATTANNLRLRRISIPDLIHYIIFLS